MTQKKKNVHLLERESHAHEHVVIPVTHPRACDAQTRAHDNNMPWDMWKAAGTCPGACDTQFSEDFSAHLFSFSSFVVFLVSSPISSKSHQYLLHSQSMTTEEDLIIETKVDYLISKSH